MRKIRKISRILIALTAFVMVFAAANTVSAQTFKKTNPNTGYEAYVDDAGNSLTDSQIEDLLVEMYSLTQYGNVGYVTTDYNSRSAKSYSESYYYDHYGNESGVLLLVDFDNRELIMSSAGEMHKTITVGVANTITDNIYRYASDGDYFKCAKEGFNQVSLKMEGKRIAQPMKHINNVLIALIIAMIINFIIVTRKSRLRKAKTKAILESAANCSLRYEEPRAEFLRTTRVYSPIKTSGGSGGGFGGGGGGFSGGSGGHKF